ncbi:MAG TPA: DUF541 domain-containing protein [Thermodesulfobacterium geofontis]|nr:DUF541 domain-containing protein [Thermodesulfobacterium geofontis]
MKRVLLLVLLLIILPQKLNAQSCEENGTRVSIILEEEKEIVPDTLSINLRISVLTQKEVEAINIMGEIDKTLKGLNLEYKGGRYSVYENCWWEKGERKCSGYKGRVEYVFLLKEVSQQNKIFEILNGFKEKYGEKLKFSIYRTDWIVSEKEAKKAEDKLRLLIIERAKEFSETVSKALDKNCDIELIDYQARTPHPLYIYPPRAMEKATVEAPEPKREEKTITVRAEVKLKCK